MSTHLEESLRRDFERIRTLIVRMNDLAIRGLRDGVAALERRDRQLAALIILRDQKIDQMEKEIDRLCLEFLVRHQPAGGHLRFAYSALLINFELERVGDYAESIARQILKLLELGARVPPNLFEDIASTSISMLHNAVTAFVRQDAALAGATAQIEEHVDVLRNQLNTELLHLVQNNQVPLAALTPLMTIARRFERVSDQGKSICHETIYICTGEYAKHPGALIYRVLFVDQHHGAPSRIAEAVGRSLNRAEFEFASAGIEPEPLPPGLETFLREKSASRAGPLPPARVDTLPNFQQYQLVLALAPGIRDRLPAVSRKSAQLEWVLPEGGQADSPEQFRAAYEAIYQSLNRHIVDLVATLTNEEPTPTK